MLVLLVAGLALAGCSGGHSTNDSSPLRYVALGDSYSSGVGGGDESGACARSDHGYPALLGRTAGIDLVRNAACSGATTDDVLSSQLGALDRRVQLVTLTIGGNDLGVTSLPSACVQLEAEQCTDAVRSSLASLATLPDKLARTYSAIAKAAPNAKILVAGYPAFFDDDATGSAEAAINAATGSLDAAIEKEVATRHRAGSDIHFVAVSFGGHGVDSAEPWFVLSGSSAFHPDPAGYVRYAATLRTAVG